MDNPVREAPPAWAKPQSGSQAPDPNRATERQMAFISSLLAERDRTPLTDEQRTWLLKVEADDDLVITKAQASRIIEALLKLPKRPVQYVVFSNMSERFAVGIPAGRYAVEADNGELRFYSVWISRDKQRLNVYVAHGPDESDLKYQKTVMGVLNKIKAAGIRQAAILYGLEIGSCSNCGRRLTNRISRELGIGPICGGRMFGDVTAGSLRSWKDMVSEKRNEIKARGEDPDEEFEDA